MDKQNHTPDDDGDQRDSPASERPKFSRRLGAPIQTVTPVGKPPSQVTGRPQSAQQEQAPQAQSPQQGQSANLGVLPGPDGQPVAGEDAADEVDPNSFYAQVGGRETFQRIVDVFYDQVAEDPHFRAHYPEADLGPARERLLMFLEQYWGGPKTYQQRRGHPRLRMRHMPFRVDAEARDTWLKYMRVAVESADLSPMHQEVLWDYLDRAAHAMVNS
ncbi:hypothetical protein GCM10023354_11620 [Garicola koreensis]|uniref:Hemoglobin n=1 Tax=Garicola koreensis TaxID=1262554 RepID=A0A7W5TNW7_9MICC|nr:hemoglobin [Garicola koreensis]